MTKDKYSVYDNNPQLNTIVFYSILSGEQVEVLRIAKEGITANPDVPVDAAAAAVIRALDGHIKNFTKRPWLELTDEDCKGMSAGDKVVAMWANRTVKEKNNG